MNPSSMSRWTAACGILAVVLNVAAVVALADQPNAYQPGELEAWRQQAVAHPWASTISAWTFTVGLVLLAAFALGVAATRATQSQGAAWTASILVAAGALLDAAGTPLVVGVVTQLAQDASAGRALLAVTLHLDATFNALLGLGLLLWAYALKGTTAWRGLAAVAGAMSLVVAAQGQSAWAARMLAVAGPLWLTWVIWTAVVLWRDARR